MELSRRKFLKGSAGAAAVFGMSLFDNPLLRKAFANALEETPIIWLAAGACSGCSVSLLDALAPRIQDVLLGQIVPGHHTELAFHPTVMAASGDLAMQAMYDTEAKPFLLVVEGAVATKDGGTACEVGEQNGHGITALDHVLRMGRKAKAVIAIGSCAAFGGVVAADPNPTGAKGVAEVFKEHGITTPTINLPGCAAHPDWFIGTVAALLLDGPKNIKVDEHARPVAYYGTLIHDNCPLRGHFDAGRFAEKASDPYCLYKLGCKGPVTHSSCPQKEWNGGTNWCIENGHPCIGCVEPEFPYAQSLATPVPIKEVTPPAAYPPIFTNHRQDSSFGPAYAGLAGIAVGAVGVKAAVKGRDRKDQDKRG